MEIEKNLNWKIPFYIGFIGSFVILFLLVNLRDKFIGLANNQMFNDFYPLFVILIIINCAIATYYYFTFITQHY